MSDAAALPASISPEVGRAPSLRPFWLRPAALLVATGLHVAAALLIVARLPPQPSPVDAIEVTMVPEGDAAEDQKAVEDTKAEPTDAPTPLPDAPPPVPEPTPSPLAEQPPPEPAPPPAPDPVFPPPSPDPTPPVAEPPPGLSAPAPIIEAPEAPPIALQTPLPVVKPVVRPTPVVKPVRRPPPQAAAKAGVANGNPQATDMSKAEYGSLLAAEIARHKFYPAAAREAGVSGAVSVSLTVGASGRVVGHAITRSSGHAELDAAVATMLAEVQAPPPPDGRFQTSTTIRFNFQ